MSGSVQAAISAFGSEVDLLASEVGVSTSTIQAFDLALSQISGAINQENPLEVAAGFGVGALAVAAAGPEILATVVGTENLIGAAGAVNAAIAIMAPAAFSVASGEAIVASAASTIGGIALSGTAEQVTTSLLGALTKDYDNINTTPTTTESTNALSTTNSPSVVVADNADLNFSSDPETDLVILGQGDTVYSANAVTVDLGGSNNVLNSGTNDDVVASGANGTVNLGSGNIFLLSGGSASVTGNTENLNLNSDTTLTASGNNNTIDGTGAETSLNVKGSSNSITLASGDTVDLESGGSNSVYMSSGTVGIAANAGAVGIHGSSDTISANPYDTVYVAGSSNTMTGYTGDSFTINSGSGNSVYMSSGTVGIAANAGAVGIHGSSDTISANPYDTVYVAGSSNTMTGYTGDSFTINSGSGNSVYMSSGTVGIAANAGSVGIHGSSDTISANPDDTVYVAGSSNTMTGYTGDSFTINSGSGNSVFMSSGTVAIAANAGAVGITGSSDTISANPDDTVYVAGSSNTMTGYTGDSFTINSGSGNSVFMSGGTVGIAANAGDVGIHGASDTISSSSGGPVYVAGSNDTITAPNGDTIGIESASNNDAVNMSSGNVYLATNDSSITIYGSNNIIDAEAGASLTIVGNNNTIDMANGGSITLTSGDSGDVLNVVGGTINAPSGISNITYKGSNNHIVGAGASSVSSATSKPKTTVPINTEGGGATISSPGHGTGYANGGYSNGGYTLTFYASAYGFSGAPTSGVGSANIGAVASYDLQQGNLAGADDAISAHADSMKIAQAGESFNSGMAVLEGAKWDSKVVTWYVASTADNTLLKESTQQAFAVWAKASGLQFEEVSNPENADISISWGTFNAQKDGVAGFTSLKMSNGQILSGTQISIATPVFSQDSQGVILSASDFFGTNTSLSQTLLHEIGHALGLGESSSAASIMYPYLTSANQTLDAEDASEINALYSGAQDKTHDASQFSGPITTTSYEASSALMKFFSATPVSPTLVLTDSPLRAPVPLTGRDAWAALSSAGDREWFQGSSITSTIQKNGSATSIGSAFETSKEAVGGASAVSLSMVLNQSANQLAAWFQAH